MYENIRWSCLLISSALILLYQSQLVLYRLQHLFQPSRLPIRMKQVVDCMCRGNESDADLQAWAYDHFTPKGKVQIEKQAASKHGLHCVAKWLAECLMLISFSIKTHSGATLVGMANWATTNLQATGESFLLQSKPAIMVFSCNYLTRECNLANISTESVQVNWILWILYRKRETIEYSLSEIIWYLHCASTCSV